MDFWEAQRKARSKTTFYLVIFIILTLSMAAIIEYILRQAEPGYDQQGIPALGLLFLLLTFGVALFQYLMYQRYGGAYVAKSAGAREVDPNNPQEKQLLNIVEEMAVAASLPMPSVFIIPAKQINAFAAGLTSDNAAIAITEGALRTLNRDEIQGVIAHEFGHIHNGDMRLSLRLAAMVMGFFFVLYLGLRLLRIAAFSGRSRGGKKGNPLLLGALLLLAAGTVTWFAGSILKACVSRQREYLADASAVQFTRHPDGIANALRKIAQEQIKDMPKQGMAFSHMYLDNHSSLDSLFATHPPLAKRIEAIEGKK